MPEVVKLEALEILVSYGNPTSPGERIAKYNRFRDGARSAAQRSSSYHSADYILERRKYVECRKSNESLHLLE
jgi:hypothetical protein